MHLLKYYMKSLIDNQSKIVYFIFLKISELTTFNEIVKKFVMYHATSRRIVKIS
jgi:hypothetical protein